jgi:hypothetical protein
MCIRFVKGGDRAISVGGNDASMMVFDIIPEGNPLPVAFR